MFEVKHLVRCHTCVFDVRQRVACQSCKCDRACRTSRHGASRRRASCFPNATM